MAFFSRRPDSYVGLDIGTSSVKLVQLRREGRDALRLETYAVANGTNPLVSSRGGDAVARMATVLREMLRRSGATSTNAVVALPSLSVFSAVLTLPRMSERDLEQAVLYAARNYVPSPLKDVVLGWTVIEDDVDGEPAPPPATTPPTPGGAAGAPAETSGTPEAAETPVTHPVPKPRPGMQEVFLTAAPKDLVARYSAVLERLGLQLVALEIESFPLSRALLREDRRPILLVDIGDLATSFSVVDRGYLRLNQSIDIGGAALTHAVVQTLGVPSGVAERQKQSEGLTGSGGAVGDALKPVLRDILERSQNIRRLYEQKRHRALSRVVLIGGSANLKGLPEFWTDAVGLPTEVGNPWKGLRVPALLTWRLRLLGPSFAVAVGLALREFEPSR